MSPNRSLASTEKNSSSRIRVGIVSPPLLLGGAERWIVSLAKHLDPERIHLTGILVTQKGNPEIEAAAWDVCPIYQAPQARLFADQCDVLIAWGHSLHVVPDPIHPVVFVSHGCGEWTGNAIRDSWPRITHYAAVSEWAAKSFPSSVRQHVEILHNGVDGEHCRTTRPREQVRATWGVEPHEIAVGFVGRLSWEKHPLALAIATATLGEPFRAVYVGGGIRESEVRTIVEQVDPRAVFVPPVYPIGDAMQALDCFLLASPSEGFSLALAEAWYCGLPTVSTPVGATPELEALYGPLTVTIPVSPSPAAMADAIRRAVTGERAEAENAQRVVREHYTAAAMGKRWSDYLAELKS